MKSNSPRSVKVEQKGKTVFVTYTQRRKGQHHSAAQFSEKTVEEVRAWVNSKPELKLED